RSYGDWSSDVCSSDLPYQLHQESAYSGIGWGGEGSFLPIHELARPNADITLAFLSFDKVYAQPINDPWFAAHQASLLKSQVRLEIGRASCRERVENWE